MSENIFRNYRRKKGNILILDPQADTQEVFIKLNTYSYVASFLSKVKNN